MKLHPVLGGALIVAGTSIGAGILALPVVTAEGGFIPAFFVYMLSWLFMCCTGLLLLEICLKMQTHTNMISMADTYLGKVGKWISWGLYLFLFYSLSTAYISGGGDLIKDTFQIDPYLASWLFLAILAPIVYIGAKMVDRVNRWLMTGLILTFFSFVFLGIKEVNLFNLEYVNWKAAPFALPVIFTSFAYQGVIPSLTYYLKKNARHARLSIVFGTTITFCMYLIWEFLILGIVPLEGQDGLLDGARQGLSAVIPLQKHTGASNVMVISRFFGFFAITTSFLGVSLGVFDFLRDGLSLSRKRKNKLLLACLTFFPPFVIALYNPGLFLVALHYAGGVGCALLLGLIPILMVWSLRYRKQQDSDIQLKGGKPVLIFLIIFVIVELFIEVSSEIFRLID